MAKRRLYTVYVDGPGCDGSYEVTATSVREAKEKAKRKYMQEWWRKSDLKCTIDSKEEIL